MSERQNDACTRHSCEPVCYEEGGIHLGCHGEGEFGQLEGYFNDLAL